MKIMWIINIVIGKLSEEIYCRRSNGLWIEALLDEFLKRNEHEIIIATVGKIKNVKLIEDGKITYYYIPDADREHYNPYKKSNQNAWKKIIINEKPDIIQIWGTEFRHGLCAQLILNNLPIGKKIPTIIFIQGILNEIAYYYFAGMSLKEIIQNTTVRDILKLNTIFHQKYSYSRRSFDEAKMLKMADGVIVENKWCKTHIYNIAPHVMFSNLLLSINSSFFEKKWTPPKTGEVRLICNASGYPLKGLHMLIRAIAIIKEKHHNIKLLIPGKDLSNFNSPLLLYGTSYGRFINKLIKKLGLVENIQWLGTLSSHRLVAEMVNCNLFILCSALENHSSSLKEAMLLGMPCVVSAVGGVVEYVKDEENALLYRFEDYQQLAEKILRIISDSNLSQHLANNARKHLTDLYSKQDEYFELINIYKKHIIEV